MANLPTCLVQCVVYDNDGAPVLGAEVLAKLDRAEVYNGYVVPASTVAFTNADGVCSLALWPNALGATESSYLIRIQTPVGKTIKLTATVPNVSTANLHEIANLPAYDGKSDGQLAIEAAIAAVAPAVAAKNEAVAAADIAVAKSQEIIVSADAAANAALSAENNAAAVEANAAQVAEFENLAQDHAAQAALKVVAAETAANNAISAKIAVEEIQVSVEGFAETAGTKAAAAASSASAAESAETSAKSEALKSKAWASKTDAEVEPGAGFGAKKYALDASSSAQSAGESANVATVKAAEVEANAQAITEKSLLAEQQATQAEAAKEAALLAKTEAEGAESRAGTHASNSELHANAAADSEAGALAIFGNTQAMQAAVNTAVNSAIAAEASAGVYNAVQQAFVQQAVSLVETQTIVVQHHAFA